MLGAGRGVVCGARGMAGGILDKGKNVNKLARASGSRKERPWRGRGTLQVASREHTRTACRVVARAGLPGLEATDGRSTAVPFPGARGATVGIGLSGIAGRASGRRQAERCAAGVWARASPPSLCFEGPDRTETASRTRPAGGKAQRAQQEGVYVLRYRRTLHLPTQTDGQGKGARAKQRINTRRASAR